MLCGAATFAVLVSCSEPPQPNLLFIVVDTLRTDHLGAWGYERDTSPAIDAFASDAIRFERAYASAPWTKPSIASMLTGLYPSMHGTEKMTASLPDESDTLAEILTRVGYDTAGVVSHRLITDEFNFRQGYRTFVKKDAKGHAHLSSAGVTRSATGLLEKLAAADRPFFLFVHYFDPHFAYQRHPEIGFAAERAGRLEGGEPMSELRRLKPAASPEEVSYIVDLYDEEIRFTDTAIGELLDALREQGLYDDTLIVFTADHGEAFYERGWLGHTRTLYDELIRVPLAIRLPGDARSGEVIREPVSLVALAATILDALRFDYSELELAESSLLPLMLGREKGVARPIFSEVDYDRHRPTEQLPNRPSGYMRSVVRGRHKLIHDRYTDRYELYDLELDPREQSDLSAQRPQLLAEMQGVLGSVVERTEATEALAPVQRPISEDDRALLEQLGYIDE